MAISLKRESFLIILSAPSGGGKTSICREVLQRDPKLSYSLSTTSRKQRPLEEDGYDYNFVSRDKFEKLIADELFYEYAEVYGNYYGTRRDLVEQQLDTGVDVIMDLDIQGGLNLKKMRPDAVLIFILPPSTDVLRHRLEKRASDSKEEVEKRMSCAQREMLKAVNYDYVVINDDFDKTIEKVQGIIEAERCSTSRQEFDFGTAE